MRKRRLERLRERAAKKQNPNKWLDAKVEMIEQRQERLKKTGARAIVPLVNAIISVVPGGAIIGDLLSRFISPNLAAKLPFLGDFVIEGRLIVDSEQKAGFNWLKIALRDIVPLVRELEEGDTLGAAFGLFLIIFIIFVILCLS